MAHMDLIKYDSATMDRPDFLVGLVHKDTCVCGASYGQAHFCPGDPKVNGKDGYWKKGGEE